MLSRTNDISRKSVVLLYKFDLFKTILWSLFDVVATVISTDDVLIWNVLFKRLHSFRSHAISYLKNNKQLINNQSFQSISEEMDTTKIKVFNMYHALASSTSHQFLVNPLTWAVRSDCKRREAHRKWKRERERRAFRFSLRACNRCSHFFLR